MNGVTAALVQHFETINQEHMQGLPIVNPDLAVEAVGFRQIDEHFVGVLITPWFMNLVLLPGSSTWSDREQGSTVEYTLPAGPYEFTVSRDDEFGTYLTAVLFRSTLEMPNQEMARDIANEVIKNLDSKPELPAHGLSRRSFFTSLGRD